MSFLDEIFFMVASLFAIVFALGTVTASNPLRAALCLLGHVVSLAGLYLSLHAELMAAIQLIVYAGAVVVLFIFTIMLLGPMAKTEDKLDGGQGFATKSVILVFIALITLTFAGGFAGYQKYLPAVCPVDKPDCGFGGIEAVGTSLFQQAAVPFELVSITLLVAIVGAIAVAKGRSEEEKMALLNQKREQKAQQKLNEETTKQLSQEVAAYEGH